MVHQKALKIFFLIFFLNLSAKGDEFPSQTEVFRKLETVLKNQTSDHFEKQVKRMGNKKISLESFVSIEADWNLLQKIAKKISNYPIWALPNINEKGGGEKFYIQIAGMTVDPKNPNNLELKVVLALPALKIPIQRVFHFEFPTSPVKNSMIMKISTVDGEDSAVQDMSGFIMFFKSPKNPNLVWAYTNVSVVLTHWLVYESLPERLLNSELGERIRISMENYQRFENTQRD